MSLSVPDTAAAPTSSLRSSAASGGFASTSSPCKDSKVSSCSLLGLPGSRARSRGCCSHLQAQQGTLLGAPPVVSDQQGLVPLWCPWVLHKAVPRGIIQDLQDKGGPEGDALQPHPARPALP